MRRSLRLRFTALALLLAAAPRQRAEPAPAPASGAPNDADEAYDAARALWDQFATPDIKRDYYFPSREEFNAFLRKLQAAYDGDSIAALAQNEPGAMQTLQALESVPGQADYTDWLAGRVDELQTAQAIVEAERRQPSPPPPRPAAGSLPVVPYYSIWYRRLQRRPVPEAAADLVGPLRAAFAAEGVPPDLIWIAEVESSMNPSAHNPSGARGLFQLKAATAQGLGLSTFLPDQRTDPVKSAHAAARLLHQLRLHYGTWPLAIAAYNAGTVRVSRALGGNRSLTYADIAPSLPAGTRIYVPEVCALVAVRTGRALAR